MKFTKRDLTVIGTFAAAVAIGCALFVRDQMRPAKPTARTARSGSGTAAAEPNGKAATQARSVAQVGPAAFPDRAYHEFAKIPERNLFKDTTKKTGEKKAPAPSVPSGPTPGPLPAPAGGDSTSEDEPDKVTVTGYITVGEGVRVALVENLTTKETKMAREGTEAFGHVVASVDANGAILRRDGREQFYALGEGKTPDTKTEKKGDDKKEGDKKAGEKKDEGRSSSQAGPPTPSPQPGGSTGFDYRNMTPEQREEFRKRWEERRRGYGGRGR